MAVAIVLYITVGTLAGLQQYPSSHAFSIYFWSAFIASCFSACLAIWFTMVGACIGSFLNVVAYRLPLGRTIGGHSGCPYCCTPIQSRDNIPVLGWLRLRGRCRTCRLPISVQYPLVELLLAMIFLAVFLTEFRSGQFNVPHRIPYIPDSQLTWVLLTTRVICYLIVLSGLTVAGLITIQGNIVPVKLFVWCVLPLIGATLVEPATPIIAWQPTMAVVPIMQRLDGLATIGFGGLSAGFLAILLSPILIQGQQAQGVFVPATNDAIRTWILSMALAGCALGWQSVTGLGWTVACVWALASWSLYRFMPNLRIGEIAAWVWLGLLIYRSAWHWFYHVPLFPDDWAEPVRFLISLILLGFFCWLVSLSQSLTQRRCMENTL